MRKQLISFVIVVAVLWAMVPPIATAGAIHVPGTNIVSNDGTIYFLTRDGKRRAYTSAGAFLSFRNNSWTQVEVATNDDLAMPEGPFIPPRDGSIMCADRGDRKGTCYLISDGWKIGFRTESDFRQLGFSFNNALYGDVSFLPERQNIQTPNEAHRPGTIVSDGRTLYFVSKDRLLGIPSADTLRAWGYEFTDAVPMNGFDHSLSRTGILHTRASGILSPLEDVGKITVTQSPLSQSRYVMPGQIGVELGLFRISAPMDRNLSIYAIGFDTFGTLPYDKLSNAKIYNRNTMQQIGSNAGNVFSGSTGLYYMLLPVNIPAGTSIDVAFTADIASGTEDHDVYAAASQLWINDTNNQPQLESVSSLPAYGAVVRIATAAPYETATARDARRLSDIRQLATALELYYNDNNFYPSVLSQLAPFYISTVPTAPAPIDGTCTSAQNSYTYVFINSYTYNLVFCLGGPTAGFGPGVRVLSQGTIY